MDYLFNSLLISNTGFLIFILDDAQGTCMGLYHFLRLGWIVLSQEDGNPAWLTSTFRQ